MDPGILRKLNKMEHSKEYGYDEKADIWSLGTACYEMLIGNCTFDAESMKELVTKVERGNYFLPSTLSKEAVSFLNGMLQYDFKKRFTAEQLYRHKFLKKKYTELERINIKDIKEIKNHITGSKIRINTKLNQSIWNVFGDGHCSTILEDVGSEDMIEESNESSTDNSSTGNIIPDIIPKPNTRKPEIAKLTEEQLKKEFLKVYESINNDLIYIEPKLLPIIPGDDPAVINKVSEFNEDNF